MNTRRHDEMECSRCANRQFIRHHGHFRDSDYTELLHEYFELEQQLRQVEARLHKAIADSQWWQDQNNWAIDHLQAVAHALLERGVEDGWT